MLDHRDLREVHRAQSTVLSLRSGYLELTGMSAPERGARKVGGRSVHAAAPIALAVIDVVREVDALVAQHVPLVRGALRMGAKVPPAVSASARTLRDLAFIAEALPSVWSDNPAYARELDSCMRHAGGRVKWVLGRENRKPHRINTLCPECSEQSLWVSPAHGAIACGVPTCGFTQGTESFDHGDGKG